MKIFNAFSGQMVDAPCMVSLDKISSAQAATMLAEEVESYVGHAETAATVSAELGVEIPFARRFGHLAIGEVALIAQVNGGRLPEGCTTLPEGMWIEYLRVEIFPR